MKPDEHLVFARWQNCFQHRCKISDHFWL